MILIIISVIFTACASTPASSAVTLNTACKAARTGAAGTCRMIDDCPSVVYDLFNHSLQPNICGYIDGRDVVCCPNPATTKAPTTSVAPHEKRISARKCEEYQDAVYDRVSVSFGFNDAPVIKKVYRCSISTVPLVVGGENAHPKEFPHMALIGFQSGNEITWGCGGSLISEQYVLTAAHCVYDSRSMTYAQYVRLGELVINATDDDAMPVDFNVTERIRHPSYKLPSRYNDIALLKLDRAVTFSQHMRPACLNDAFIEAPTRVLVTGWGALTYRGKASEHLQKAVLELYSHSECQSFYENNTSRVFRNGIEDATQLCAGWHNASRDSCQGDSGGPLQIYHPTVGCMYSIAGITSNGRGCGNYVPGIYTRVSHYLDWIESVVWPQK